jgi:hypothetical protein
MAVHLKPCHGCPIPQKIKDKRCLEKRAEMRAKVSGLGLTSAKFNCDILAGHFAPGTRLTINTPVLRSRGRYDDDGYWTAHVEVKATVLGFYRNRFQCVVDHDEMVRAQEQDQSGTAKDPREYMYRKPMLPARVIRFLDEPKGDLCIGGNVVVSDGKCDRSGCINCCPSDFVDYR